MGAWVWGRGGGQYSIKTAYLMIAITVVACAVTSLRALKSQHKCTIMSSRSNLDPSNGEYSDN